MAKTNVVYSVIFPLNRIKGTVYVTIKRVDISTGIDHIGNYKPTMSSKSRLLDVLLYGKLSRSRS